MSALTCRLLGVAAALALAAASACADDDWLKEEVLKQLAEIRQDNLGLRKEVEALKRQLAPKPPGGEAVAHQPKAPESRKKLAELLGSNAPLGRKTAALVMVEFTDYECPYCRKYDATAFPWLKRDYIDTGKLRYAARDFPLPFHGQAAGAAVAARCAGGQGAYWAMRTALFQHQDALGKDGFTQQAAALKLDAGRFGRCLDDPKIRQAVDGDVAYGNRLGVQATPTFLIGRIDGAVVKNIKAIAGAMSPADLARQLDALLEAH